MALAPYISKAALGASQLLAGVSPKKFQEILERLCVGVVLDSDSNSTVEVGYLSELLINLLSRLYPSLVVVGTQPAISRLEALARSINPNIEFANPEAVNVWVVVGALEQPPTGAPTIYVGSAGWAAHISSRPTPCGKTKNPFGAGAAACIAAANVFRIVFSDQMANALPDSDLSLCLFDYKVNDPQCKLGHPQPQGALKDGTILVGAGAIGNGALWALSRASISGVLDVVDPQSVDETNPQRYVLADAAYRGSKVAMACDILRNHVLEIRPHQCDWAEFLESRPDCLLVAVSVDTAQTRVEIQSSLPKHILNAWTQAGDLGVSRHRFLGDQACLACLYIPPRASPSEDLLVQLAIRFSGDLMAVRNMLYSDAPLDMTWIERIAADMKLDKEKVLPYLGRPLRELYQRGVCGGTLLTIADENESSTIEIPMAFQSALAGIMLASEIALYSMQVTSAPPPVTTKINVLKPIGPLLSESERKHISGRCICQDLDFIEAYRRKFPVSLHDAGENVK